MADGLISEASPEKLQVWRFPRTHLTHTGHTMPSTHTHARRVLMQAIPSAGGVWESCGDYEQHNRAQLSTSVVPRYMCG